MPLILLPLMQVLIAPNAFKNSLSATDAAKAIESGLRHSRLNCSCELFPIGDGGDGTAELLVRRLQGETVAVEVQDPLGRAIRSRFSLVDKGRTAVIELADASGLRLLQPQEYDPLQATSFGTGELIKSALDRGVRHIVLGVGGSATVDGAAGIALALGARFLNAGGAPLRDLPARLTDLHTIDTSGIDPRLQDCSVTIMCDVENALLGEHGAAAVFGPQKGAAPPAVDKLEQGLRTLAEVLRRQTGTDVGSIAGGGAAGGVAAGLHALLKARLVRGIDYFLDAAGFDDALRSTDLLITGEGSIDEQTLQGKAPHGVALRAKANGVPVAALAGRVPLEENFSLQEVFQVLLPIGAGPVEVAQAIRETARNLQRTALQLGNALALLTIPNK